MNRSLGWALLGPAFGASLAPASDAPAFAQGPLALTRICVEKFEDVNGNGARDPGEPPMENVQFGIVGPSTHAAGVTDVLGRICFQIVSGGSYTIRETVPAGWITTSPAGAVPEKTVTVQSGGSAVVTFANRRQGPQPTITNIDLGIDTDFRPVTFPNRNPSMFLIVVRADQTIAAGRELVVQGQLLPVGWFAPFTAATVTPGWSCTGIWSAFVCRTTLAAPLVPPAQKTLEIRTSYAPNHAHALHNFTASVWLRYNADPGPAGHSLFQVKQLY